jgi:hypothetical protein
MPGTSRSGRRPVFGGDCLPSDGRPELPAGSSPAFSAKWKALLEQLPPGVLRRVDGHLLRVLVALLVQSEELESSIEAEPNDLKLRRCFHQTVQQIARLSPMFGLSPLDRRRMKLEADTPGDDAEEWLAE